MRRALLIASGLAVALSACAAPPRTTVRAAKPATPRTVLAEEPWIDVAPNGRMLTTARWRVLTTVEPLSSIDRELPDLLEHALSVYTSRDADLPDPDRALPMHVLASRPQWARLTQRLFPNEAPRLLGIQRGGYTANARSVLFDIGPRDTLALATHEGWHLYTQTTFRDPLPVWLEEGLAVSMEGLRTDERGRPRLNAWANVERFDQLRVAEATGSLLPLPVLLSQSPAGLLHASPSADVALTWYAQVWALVHFLREHEGGKHRSALASLLGDAAAGDLSERLGGRALAARNGAAVYAAYFDDDLTRADAAYRAFVQRIVRTGGKDRIVAGRSPIR